jgi:hypothetical protein
MDSDTTSNTRSANSSHRKAIQPAEVKSNIQIISALPSKFINLLGNWDDRSPGYALPSRRLDCTAAVHHVADSHINAYTRCRLAMTEDNPVIKPYEEHLG